MHEVNPFLKDDYYLSVDGGGTSCKTCLYNASGQILGEGLAGAANARLGTKRVMNEIMLATKAAFKAAGVDYSNITRTHACFGLAGLELKRDQNNFYATETLFKSVILETDGVTACLGAFSGADGAIVIIGTGSSAVSMNNNVIHNIGGWGFEISDGGSGAVLGRNAVRYALRAQEGLEPQTPLVAYIMDYFNNDISEMVLWAEKAEAKDYAMFTAKVFDLAENGDAAAVGLLDIHKQELVQFIEGILAFGAPQFTLLGGLATRSVALLPANLAARYVESQNNALYGGFLRITKSLTGSRVKTTQKFANTALNDNSQPENGGLYVKN